MKKLTNESKIGVMGSGTMGIGIALVAAINGHEVFLFEVSSNALERAKIDHKIFLKRSVEKGKKTETESNEILNRIHYRDSFEFDQACSMYIEAIVENLELKQEVFSNLDKLSGSETILCSNTSSLSITSIAAACENQSRVIGTHFFNPAPLLPLVEIVPGIETSAETVNEVKELIAAWGKSPVIAKDTPGFIVNRVARPFYGEALRILEESIADVPTIDWALKKFGGFKMGPFELMDMIGNDVNFSVTETVFKEFYYDPRFKPSLIQKRLVEAKHFGRKSGKGFYDYSDGAAAPQPVEDEKLGKEIVNRILSMLINEAADAVYMNIASKEDVDLAMTKGTNYPKGLLKWADEIGIKNVVHSLTELKEFYDEDRYRVNPLLKNMAKNNLKFYE
ncbi:MAG: 3-hydroxybutyryl-CoA dehydrogenase [Ignavibacteriae bacterium]|nr:3-hydroxybutyryl-CoA dehydrogenase [Ignavibacteriota bacterium]NOG98911.1 3-hydroxybutyryl-CoA dehydrogenase [Ignavibacteriota bacterium]